MSTRKMIVGMVLLVCIVVPVRATTYYVATDGNDSNPGSEAQPWKTIQKAANTMQAGDTVYIKEGTYVEQVEPKNSGSEANWITYQAYPSDEVIIESPNTVWSNYCITLKEPKSLEYLHFKNLTLKGVGQGVTAACFKATGDAQGGKVKSHIILEGLTITNAYHGVAFRSGVTDSEIKDCNIYDNGNGISFYAAIRNILISGNHISYCYADPNVNSNGDGIVMSGNYSQIPDGNMCSNITITNNLVHHVDRQGMLITASKNVLIRGNHCHHNAATGIQIESDPSDPNNVPICKNIVIEDNLCEDNACKYAGETGIWVDDNNDVIVQNNILRRNEVGLEITGSFNVIARNNIIYENNRSTSNAAAGIEVYETTQRGACGNDIIVHNTLYRNGGTKGDTDPVLAQVLIGRSDINLPADNTVFKNNISSNSLASKYCEYLDLRVYGLNPELNFNNYYQPVESLKVCWQSEAGEVNIISWPEYLSSSGQDSNSITSDPCFINLYNEDFHLHPNSKCIDAGAFLTTADANRSGTSLVVADSRYFTDGYGLIDGDLIKVGSNPLVRVLDVNYDTNTLYLDQSISWNAGDGVSYAYLGNAPDIGAYEYGPLVYNKSQSTSYESIQEAIGEALSGDEIVVYPGTYYEDISFNGKAMTLRSTDPNDWDVVAATVIDGNGASTAVILRGNSRIEGLTVKNENAGNAIYCYDSSEVRKCLIQGHTYGIMCQPLSSPVISNNKIFGCEHGIYVCNAGVEIKNNWIYGNSWGIRFTSFRRAFHAILPIISNNTLVSNSLFGIRVISGISPTISNCILWNNGDDLYNCNATYSCIEDIDAGTGNIHNDPRLVDADSNNFHIGIHSPCVNAGDPNRDYTGQTDIDGESRVLFGRVDMGADEAYCPYAHWWKFDECNGTTAYDSIADNDGIFNGNDPCWVTGKFDGAVDFNGINDYFSVPTLDGAYDKYDVFTVAGWFKTDQSTGKQTIVGEWWQDGVWYHGWQVLVENSKVVARFGYENEHIGTADVTGTSDVNVGEWHQFALVRNGMNSVVLYVDGQPEGTSGDVDFDNDLTKFRIGDGSYGYAPLKGGPFNGIIDDVMILNKALSAEEVEQLYQEGLE